MATIDDNGVSGGCGKCHSLVADLPERNVNRPGDVTLVEFGLRAHVEDERRVAAFDLRR
jgi:hypothetical protein